MPLLSREETLRLVVAAQAGSSRAEDDLIRAHYALARSVAGRFARLAKGRLDYEDVLQEARLGLLHAIRGFEPGHGCTFSTYAVTAMNRRCQRAIADSDPIRVPTSAQERGFAPPVVLSLDHPVGEEEADTLCEMIAAEDDVEREAVASVWTAEVLSQLHRRERVAIELHVIGEEPLAAVARRVGLTGEGSRRLVKRGLERLRRVSSAA